MYDWTTYYEKTKNRPAATLLVQAMEYVSDFSFALDLGAGAFPDSRYLLSVFSHVTAIDKEGQDMLQDVKFEFLKEDFSALAKLSHQYNLINAQYALPFAGKNFKNVWKELVSHLKPGGVFVGQFFGDRDDWNVSDSGLTFHSKEEVQSLLGDFDIKFFREEDKQGPTITGTDKHWHVFHVIAIRK